MIITLVRVYIVIVGLMTLTLFQGHRYVRNKNYRLHVLDSCPLKFKHYMVATYIKKMHSVICVTDVYSREILNMFLVGQVSGLVKNCTITTTLGFTVINVKLCMMVLLIELHLSIPLQ